MPSGSVLQPGEPGRQKHPHPRARVACFVVMRKKFPPKYENICSAAWEARIGLRSELENHKDELELLQNKWVRSPQRGPRQSQGQESAGDTVPRGAGAAPCALRCPRTSMATHQNDPGEGHPLEGEKALCKAVCKKHGADPEQAEEEAVPSAPRPAREHPRPPAAPLKFPRASEEQRGWGEVANISISEEVTCDLEGGSIVPFLRGTQTLVSLSA